MNRRPLSHDLIWLPKALELLEHHKLCEALACLNLDFHYLRNEQLIDYLSPLALVLAQNGDNMDKSDVR